MLREAGKSGARKVTEEMVLVI